MRNGQLDIGPTQAVAEKTDSAEKNPSNGRLFISYAREDLAKAQWLKIELRKSGYNIDYDANIETGKKYPDDIYARIQDCDKLIVLWSKSSIGSLWVCVEVAWAHGHVFPIVIDEKDDEGQGIALPDPFQHDHAENLTSWKDGVADPVQFQLILAKLQKQVKVPERVEEYFGFYANYAKELQDLIDNLTAPRPKPTIVYGPLGAGKNTLCIKALNDERVVDTYKRCIYPVDLSDAEDIQRVAGLTAEALGIKASIEPGAKHQSKLIAAIKNEINETPSILFFQNAQKCLYTHQGKLDVGLLREFFGDIKRSCESCKSVFIITILGGQNLSPHFHCKKIHLSGLSPEYQRRLFLEIADESFERIVPSGDDLSTLLEKTSGLPLDITLLAHRAQTANWDELQNYVPSDDKTESAFKLAQQDNRFRKDGKRLLSILAALPEKIKPNFLADLAQILPGDFSISEARQQLAAIGIMSRRDEGASLSFSLRAYAQKGNVMASEDREALRGYAAALAFSANFMERGEARLAQRKLEGAFTNIYSILYEAVSGGRCSCAGICRKVWEAVDELKLYSAEHINRSDMSDEQLLLAAGIALGRYQRFAGVGDTSLLEEILKVCRARGFKLQRAECLRVLGFIKRARGDFKGARKDFEEAQKIYSDIPDPLMRRVGAAHCLRNLGQTARLLHDMDGAKRKFSEALTLYSSVQEEIEETPDLGAACSTGYGGTATRAQEVLKGSAVCLARLAAIALHQNEVEEARTLFEKAKALASRDEVNDRLTVAGCHKGFGDLAADYVPAEAETLYKLAFEEFEQIGYTQMAADCLYSLGDLMLKKPGGEWRAQEYYTGARERYRKCTCDHGMANCDMSLADLVLIRWNECKSVEIETQNNILNDLAVRYDGALKEFSKTDDNVNQANCWQGLSDVGRLQQKSLQECRRFEETAARLARREEQPAIEGRGCMSHRWR